MARTIECFTQPIRLDTLSTVELIETFEMCVLALGWSRSRMNQGLESDIKRDEEAVAILKAELAERMGL